MDKREVGKATFLIMALFFLQPMTYGAWLAMIPHVKELLELSKSTLALTLLGMPLALIPTLQWASRIVSIIGPRQTFARLLPVQTLCAIFPFWANGPIGLFFALAAFGMVIAFLEVGLNTYAGRLEKSASILIMARCHGFWALGVGAGSFLAMLFFVLGPVWAVFLIGAVSTAVAIGAGLSLPRLQASHEGPAPAPQKFKQMPRALFLISAFVLFVTIAEGAMSDWSAVYLAERWGRAPHEVGIAVSIFAGFLAAGRFMGDFMKRRLGARGVARLTVGLALIGVLCLTVPNSVGFVFLGLILMGLGTSIGFPLGISAAAALDDHHEAQNIATMSMIAISGFLVGPPAIGFVAEAISLRAALFLLLPGLLVSFWLTGVFPDLKSRDSDSNPR